MKRTDWNVAHSAQGVMMMTVDKPTACGSACGSGDKPAEKSAACGSACGSGDKAEKPAARAARSSCGYGDHRSRRSEVKRGLFLVNR